MPPWFSQGVVGQFKGRAKTSVKPSLFLMPAKGSQSPVAARFPGRACPKIGARRGRLQSCPTRCKERTHGADIVAERYKVSREYQDEYSLESQRGMAAAQQANKFKDEIVPMKTKMKMVD